MTSAVLGYIGAIGAIFTVVGVVFQLTKARGSKRPIASAEELGARRDSTTVVGQGNIINSFNNNQAMRHESPRTPLKSYSPHPALSEIRRAGNSVAPFQRESAIESFKGNNIQWVLYVRSIVVNKGFMANVLFLDGSDNEVYSYIDTGEFPRLKTTPRNQPVLVRGTILGEKFGAIFIETDEITFDYCPPSDGLMDQ